VGLSIHRYVDHDAQQYAAHSGTLCGYNEPVIPVPIVHNFSFSTPSEKITKWVWQNDGALSANQESR